MSSNEQIAIAAAERLHGVDYGKFPQDLDNNADIILDAIRESRQERDREDGGDLEDVEISKVKEQARG